jgi:Fe-S cluster assembly protein SufD
MVLSTAAMETQFAEAFKKRLEGEENDALRQLRELAFAAFSAKGFPTQKDEDWKYTNVAPLAGVDWSVDSGRANVPAALDFDLLKRFSFKRNGFTALNLAFADLAVLTIEKDTVVDEPIELNFAAADGTAIFPHVVVVVGAGSKATLIESYSTPGKGFTNAAVQIFVEDNANLTYYRVQKDSPEAFHYSATEGTLAHGVYDSTNINLGGALSRHDIDLKFTAEGGEAWVDGLYMLNGTQHADTHSIIDHQVPNCVSHQNYKGVMNDKSRAVFNGKVFVRENAHGTDAQQSNKNLLLSGDARVDTKPQLEIFNDDVSLLFSLSISTPLPLLRV